MNTKDRKYNINSENALWKAVIMQAVMDVINSSSRTSNILAKQNAVDWLSLDNKDFITVCSYAKLNPKWVLAKVDFAIKNPKLWRRDCDMKYYQISMNYKS